MIGNPVDILIGDDLNQQERLQAIARLGLDRRDGDGSDRPSVRLLHVDGNDLVAAHFIGFIGGEPAACLRVRFFGEFAKIERLAVRHQFRRSRISFKLVQASFEYIKRKGFKKVYGHAQDRLVNFWAHFGAKPLPNARPLTFSDFSYTEVLLELEPTGAMLDLGCGWGPLLAYTVTLPLGYFLTGRGVLRAEGGNAEFDANAVGAALQIGRAHV